MDVKTLYTMVSIADHGSFNGAAKALGLSLSAVSLQIKALEDEVGMVLFDRSKRPPPLTGDGRDLVEKARGLIADWERLSGTLKKSSGSGVLKIGAVHTVVSGALPPALLDLRKRRPDLDVRLTTGLTHELEAALMGGRIDVAIVTEPESLASGLTFEAFSADPLVVIAGRDTSGQTFRDVLEHQPYVRFARQARVAHLIDSALADAGITVNSHMEIDTLEGVVSLVGAGLGVSIVPARREHPFPQNIRVLAFGDPPITRRLGLLSPESGPRRRFVGDLLDALVATKGQPVETVAE